MNDCVCSLLVSQDMLRDEGREINHHGRVRKFDADGNEIEEDSEDDGVSLPQIILLLSCGVLDYTL